MSMDSTIGLELLLASGNNAILYEGQASSAVSDGITTSVQQSASNRGVQKNSAISSNFIASMATDGRISQDTSQAGNCTLMQDR